MAVSGIDGWVSALGAAIDDIANNYITVIVEQLTAALAPIVLIAMTIWWMLLGWAVMRGEVQNTVTTVIWKAIKTTLIVSFAINAGFYNSRVVTFADGLRDGMATVFASAAVTEGVTPTTMWGTIDGMANALIELLNTAAKDATWYDVTVWIAIGFMVIGFVALALAAIYIAVLSKLFGTFFIGVGPLFIACLLFKPTQRFFDGWLGMVLNTVVLSWIGLFVVGFSVNVSQKFARSITDGWVSGTINPFATGIEYCCLCLVLAMMIYQAPSWAAALTGGSSMQMGAAMARDAAMTFRAARGNPAPASNTNNSIQQQSRLARLSNALGRGAGAATRMGGAVARSAKYRMAALRGRG